MEDKDESELTPEEAKERRIMTLLLRIKNGSPPMRKSSLRQITEKAREFGDFFSPLELILDKSIISKLATSNSLHLFTLILCMIL